MRALVALLAAGLAASPVAPEAADPVTPRPAPARGGRAAPSRQSAPAPPAAGGAVRPAPAPGAATVTPGVRPAPPPSGRYGGTYGGRYPYSPYYPHYPYHHYYPYYPYWAFGLGFGFGLGWGWGYPYYPYYPYYPSYGYAPDYPTYPYYPDYPPPAYPPYTQPPAPGPASLRDATPVRPSMRVSLQGGANGDAGAGALAIGVDGRSFGFQGSLGAVGEDRLRGVPGHREPVVGWGLAHATWSVLASDSFRVRLEGGLSMLYMPSSDAFDGQPYAETLSVGPSMGVSGHARLVGPLGIEGHARVTPLPVQVADTRAAAVLRFGPVGIAAGWRFIDVDGDGVDGPKLRYSGPELALSLGL